MSNCSSIKYKSSIPENHKWDLKTVRFQHCERFNWKTPNPKQPNTYSSIFLSLFHWAEWCGWGWVEWISTVITWFAHNLHNFKAGLFGGSFQTVCVVHLLMQMNLKSLNRFMQVCRTTKNSNPIFFSLGANRERERTRAHSQVNNPHGAEERCTPFIDHLGPKSAKKTKGKISTFF